MIKVAIVLDDPGGGGAYRVATDIAAGLDKSMFETSVFFLCENQSDSFFLGKPSININYSLKSYLRLAFFTKQFEKYFPPLNYALNEYQPDIIHFHTHSTLLSIVEGIKKTIPNSKIIFTDHSQRLRQGELPYFKQYLMSKVYSRLFRFSKVVYVSEYAYQTALKLGYGKKDKDFLISNTVDTGKFRPGKAYKADESKVVYLSRIHHAKGHHLLLDAWKKLPQKDNVSLHLYGIEADGGSVTNRINQENFPNPVFYEGITSSPEVVLQNAQIGVFPSFREGLPLALLEMMACGLPVVASDIPEIKSILTNGHDGLLFKSGDANDLAAKIEQLINEQLLRSQLGNEAINTTLKHYNMPIAKKYSELYQRVL